MKFAKSILDLETGVIEENVLYKTKNDQIRELQSIANQKRKYHDYLENKMPVPTYLQNQYGSFYFCHYQRILDAINGDSATAFRFLYLCTFSDYDGYVIDKSGSRLKPNELNDLLDVAPRTFTNIKHTLFDNELLFKSPEGFVFINPMYCNRGDMLTGYKRRCTRIFDTAIQDLYKNSTFKEHKQIGYLVLLLPYVNVYHNIICLNPEEKNMDKVQIMTQEEIASVISVSKNHITKIKRFLLDITVGGHPLLLIIEHKNLKLYAVNPAVFYAGTNINDVYGLDQYFKANGGKRNYTK